MAKRNKSIDKEIGAVMYRICSDPECAEPCKVLCEENFYWRKETKNFRSVCIDCWCRRNMKNKKIRSKEKKELKLLKQKLEEIRPTKICSMCGVEKLKEGNFYLRNDSQKYRDECIECRSLRNKEYRKNNKEELREKEKQKYIKNKKQIQIRCKEYREKNKETIKKSKNEYEKQRKQSDFTFKLRKSVAKTIRYYLQHNGSKKNGQSILGFLPYTIEELKVHIESLFEPWMSWDNWGSYNPETWDDNDPSTWTWSLDHKTPQSDLPYDSMEHPNFLKCWDFSNLRPYSAKQNVIDGATKIRHQKVLNGL